MEQIRNPFIGHPAQLIRINDYKMVGGFADGVRATDVNNGAVQFTVLADRGMDMPFFSFKGVNTGYVAPVGVSSPAFFDDKGLGFLRNFNAGFLTTCGVTYMGAACDADGAHYGLHGRIGNTPAEEYSARLTQNGGVFGASITGNMRESVLFGENVTLSRELSCAHEEKGFSFTDTVVNRGYRKEQHMLLYHFNFGYPLLDVGTELIIPASSSAPRDAVAETGYDVRGEVPAPISGYKEMCYFYDLLADADGQTCVGAYNHNLGFGVVIEFDRTVLEHFTQWKMVGEGEYTIGMEPATATPMGFAAEREMGHVKYMEPGEVRKYEFKISVIEGKTELAELRNRIAKFC